MDGEAALPTLGRWVRLCEGRSREVGVKTVTAEPLNLTSTPTVIVGRKIDPQMEWCGVEEWSRALSQQGQLIMQTFGMTPMLVLSRLMEPIHYEKRG